MATTLELDFDIQAFDGPVKITPTNAWQGSKYDAFKIVRQAKSGTGVYCRLFRVGAEGQVIPASETLKHLKIQDGEVFIKFDRDYKVGQVTA